uniref:Ovule protein n=1 Tax=Rhabditophanes sp. KR3021 TaxID=114890 RepID=A0AC35UD93_9BILA
MLAQSSNSHDIGLFLTLRKVKDDKSSSMASEVSTDQVDSINHSDNINSPETTCSIQPSHSTSVMTSCDTESTKASYSTGMPSEPTDISKSFGEVTSTMAPYLTCYPDAMKIKKILKNPYFARAPSLTTSKSGVQSNEKSESGVTVIGLPTILT